MVWVLFSRGEQKLRKHFYIIAGIFLGVSFFLGTITRPIRFDSLQEELAYYVRHSQYDKAEAIYWKVIGQEPLNIDSHVAFIRNHYAIPPTVVRNDSMLHRDDMPIIEHYTRLAANTSPDTSDIGSYGLGLIGSLNSNYEEAFNHLMAVRNGELKYLNNSLGFIYLYYYNDLPRAEQLFNREIELNGNIEGAYSNLIALKLYVNDIASLRELLNDPVAGQFFPQKLKRQLYLQHANLYGYFKVILFNYRGLEWISLLGALLIVLIYIVYLRKIDIYEPERWRFVVVCFLMGVFFSEFTFLLYDISSFFLDFDLNGRILNDFLYCILGIGLIEEMMKLIPLLILVRYSRQVNEPIDFIVYGSVSALGFAFAENLIYFQSYGPEVFTARALTAVVFHMFLTSLVAYGFIIRRYRGRGRFAVVRYFVLSMLIHGLYDFWLVNDSVNLFRIVSILLYILCLVFYNTMIRNSLNYSQFFDSRIVLNHKKLQGYLLYSLTGVFVLQYAALVLRFGLNEGSVLFKNTIYSGAYLILFVSMGLGAIRLKQGEWGGLPRLRLKAGRSGGCESVDGGGIHPSG